jgi:phospholipid/cholesterol/gamma-HCH transport system permease protein
MARTVLLSQAVLGFTLIMAALVPAAANGLRGPQRSGWNSASLRVIKFFEWFGDLGVFFVRTARSMFARPFEWKEFSRQLDEIGTRSWLLVALAGAATGVVISLETRDSLVRFGAKSLLPAVVIISIIRESGPIITGLILSGRVGAGIGAELGAMKVTEQVDAMEASAVNPYKYLVGTRVLACVLMLPLLTLVTDFCGIVMGWVTSTLIEPVSIRFYIETGFKDVTFNDFLPTTAKTAVFGLILGVIGCFQGMRTEGGTQGVERAATSAVVISALMIILADVLLVRFIQVFFP